MAANSTRDSLPVPENRWHDGLKDGRAYHRVPAGVGATLLSSAIGRIAVTVVDLSQSGCRVATRLRCHVGDHYVLRLDGVGPRLVTVKWRAGDEVGLSFAEPISWTIVSQVVFGPASPY